MDAYKDRVAATDRVKEQEPENDEQMADRDAVASGGRQQMKNNLIN